MAKTVVTYSWLARKAMALFRKDRSEYRKLFGVDGSDKILRGASVGWSRDTDHSQCFRIRAGDKELCRLVLVSRGGKKYTWYLPRWTSTEYRKRIVDKYLPWTLPEGVRSRHNQRGCMTKCIYHNADGSVARDGIWTGGRPRRPGYPDLDTMICDDTGALVLNPDGLKDERCEALAVLGWFDEASQTRKEWLDSIRLMPTGFCDTDKMLTVAAKAYLAAARMCEKYPKMRMALFPSKHWDPEDLYGRQGGTEPVVIARREREPVLWSLPEVMVYWEEERSDGFNYFLRLFMKIPPHGNPGLDPTGKSGQASVFQRDPRHAALWWQKVPTDERGWEYAYHQLRAYRDDVPADARSNNIPLSGAWYPHGQPPEDWKQLDERLVVWPEAEDRVLVQLHGRHHHWPDLDNLPFDLHTPIAMKPENVMALFEERMLLDSLPLC